MSGVALSQDHVTEVCRCGAGELHCIAAIMGGMAAQVRYGCWIFKLYGYAQQLVGCLLWLSCCVLGRRCTAVIRVGMKAGGLGHRPRLVAFCRLDIQVNGCSGC